MGAWIEIALLIDYLENRSMSHPTMGAWIEISVMLSHSYTVIPSHPTMGAWIEITEQTLKEEH